MRLLVTGFPPFPGRPENPSEGLVRAVSAGAISLSDGECHAALLPVEYAGVEHAVDDVLLQIAPTHWVAFGVGRQTCPIRFERRGRNRDHASIPDNAGELRTDSLIDPSGPPQRRLQHDYDSLLALLAAVNIPAEISDDAGAYVCNHLLYYSQKRLEEIGVNCQFVFIHLAPAESGLPVEKLLFALQIIVGWFQNHQADSFETSPQTA